METQMSSSSSLLLYLSLLVSLLLLLIPSPCRSDPDPLQDFCVAKIEAIDFGSWDGSLPCKAFSKVVADDFFFGGLAKEGNTSNSFGFRPTPANVFTFPGLNTLGLSMSRLDFAPGGLIPPHSHPRATELIMVLKGRLRVGFVSTATVFYSKVLKAGELFVVPRGLPHFQYNVGKGKAASVAIFNSQSPGGLMIPSAVFGSTPSIPFQVLAKSFRVDEEVIRSITSQFGH